MNARAVRARGLALLPGLWLLCAARAAVADGSAYVPPLPVPEPASGILQTPRYQGNAAVGRIAVEVARNGLPADGQSATDIDVRLFDHQGQPLRTPVMLTVEVSGGRLLLPNAATDELGSRPRDADPAMRGTQIKVADGQTHFELLAPADPQDVRLRVTAGEVSATGVISFNVEQRHMVAVGLLDGVVGLSHGNSAQVPQLGIDDGFEQQLTRWSHSFQNGDGELAARAAMFMKGTIANDTLLTLAFDSEKQSGSALLRDLPPEPLYPVNGDAAITGFDARSADRLYVRLDQQKNYLLYGDFSTGDGFTQLTSGGAQADLQQRRLGAYNRTFTGLRGHWEQSNGVFNFFADRDNDQQVVDEYRANGTSGPFAVSTSSAIANSEKVELLVRDRNQLDIILSDTVLQRMVDYTFEPFSGRLLFTSPIPSLDPNGNPESIRVTYEVSQGGEQFWVVGADGQYNLTPGTTVGGNVVDDTDPLAPYRLGSVNVGTRLGPHTQFVAEYAYSQSRVFDDGGSMFTTPTGQAGETTADQSGGAWRGEFKYQGDNAALRGWYVQSDLGFDNPSSGITAGRQEAGLKASATLSPRWQLTLDGLQVQDRQADASRDGSTLTAAYRLRKRVKLLAGVRYARERGDVGSQSFIAPNPAPGSLQSPTGGFAGGIDAGQINPLTGQLITQNVDTATSAAATTGADLDRLSGFVGAQWDATERLRTEAQAESSLAGDSGNHFELGSTYQFAERARLYARAEENTGLTSIYSLDAADASRAVVVGVDTTYLQTSDRNGQLFSEYRLRDSQNGYVAQAANGLRNSYTLSPGLALSTGAEYLHVLSGDAASAAALTFGIDYTGSQLWKGATRLEWRRTFDDPQTPGNDAQDSWLSTVNVARKLDASWTMLARNYYLLQVNDQTAAGLPLADAWEDRLQYGFAYRPVDTNRFDSLMSYEWRLEHDIAGDGADTSVHVFSILGNYHPDRRWWWNQRLAAKYEEDRFSIAEGGTRDHFMAWLAASRLTYDLTEKWDLGGLAGVLASTSGHAAQYAVGLELGRAVYRNLWVSFGVNVSGFNDKDLTGSDYTSKGVYLRVRFKFDEHLFSSNDPDFNRSLDR